MSLARTLRKVNWEIQKGDLGKARDRLQGLLSAYPNDLTLRRKLGEIHWKLHYPASAGKYWYLESEQTSDMQTACEAFEKRYGGDPLHILLALKFRGDPQALESDYARDKLLALHQAASARYGNSNYMNFRNKGGEKFRTKQEWKRTKIGDLGCTIVMWLGLAMIAIGLVTSVKWVIELFK